MVGERLNRESAREEIERFLLDSDEDGFYDFMGFIFGFETPGRDRMMEAARQCYGPNLEPSRRLLSRVFLDVVQEAIGNSGIQDVYDIIKVARWDFTSWEC